MWILYACGSALFAGLTSILAKIGIQKTDSTLATALRTIVVVIFSIIMVFVTGQNIPLSSLSAKTLTFLVLSGLCTGGSWLCFYKALQEGTVSQVVPIDKTSTLMVILASFFLFGETINMMKIGGILAVAAGTWLMLDPKDDTKKEKKDRKSWIAFAFGSAVFAALATILGKLGVNDVPSNYATLVRTCVVLVMAWMMVFVTHKQKDIKKLDGHELLFISLSGVATGASWLCYFAALQSGITSVVVSIDKLSILVTILFSWIFLHEKISLRAWLGLACLVLGTFLLMG